MRHLRTITFTDFLLIVSIPVFLSCTGQSGQKPIDTDTILGRSQKAFYNTLSPTSAKVILTAGAGEAATLEQINGGAVSGATSLSPDAIHFSQDGNIITVNGQLGIYEYSKVSVSSISSGSVPLPSPTIETYCNGFSVGGYSELLVQSVNGFLSFVAVGNGKNTNLANSTPLLKTLSDSLIVYNENGYGTLNINTTSPSPSDSKLFQSQFSPWPSASLFCHVNNVPILNHGGKVVVAMTTPSTAIQNFTVPAGVNALQIELMGGGGGGGSSDQSPGTSPGGGGGAYSKAVKQVTPGQAISYFVGAGGLGAQLAIGDGASGTASICDTFSMTAGGGAGGGISVDLGTGRLPIGAGGTATGGEVNTSGISADAQGAGGAGAPPLGGSGGVSGATQCLGSGPGGAASSPGGGGGGGCVDHDGNDFGIGGNGANGEVVFTYTSP